MFGSFARRELTRGSDVDWSLLIDGPSSPQHFHLVHDIGRALDEEGFTAPGTSGTFGSMVSSHELIHHIGGVQDTNQNLTRRLLLLLESLPVGDDLVHDRVVRNILDRYLVYDPSVSKETRARTNQVVPRFLLNDVVRFWRTMAVDYAAKRWEQGNRKWAVRNAKLRLSRKLLFAAGMLLCFSYELSPPPEEAIEEAGTDEGIRVDFFAERARRAPTDTLAEALLAEDRIDAARLLFDSYDRFVAILDDSDERALLTTLRFDDADGEPLFQEIRELGRRFQGGLDELFFESPRLGPLIRRYGVF